MVGREPVAPWVGSDVGDPDRLGLVDQHPEQPVTARQRADSLSLLAGQAARHEPLEDTAVVGDPERRVAGPDELADAIDDELEHPLERQHAGDPAGRQVEGLDEVQQGRGRQPGRPERGMPVGRLVIGHDREPSSPTRAVLPSGPRRRAGGPFCGAPDAPRLAPHGYEHRPQLRRTLHPGSRGPLVRSPRRRPGGPDRRSPVAARIPARCGDRRGRPGRSHDRLVHAGRRTQLDVRTRLQPGRRGVVPAERGPERRRQRPYRVAERGGLGRGIAVRVGRDRRGDPGRLDPA